MTKKQFRKLWDKNIKKQKDEIHKERTFPKMKGLPKIHKKEIGIRPIVNRKGKVLENLAEEMAKVFKIIRDKQRGKTIKNSEELIREGKDMVLRKEDLLFNLEKLKRLIGEEEIIRGWRKKEILETLRYIWNNTYWIIEDEVVKVNDGLGMGSKMSPILAEIVMRKWEEEKVEEENKVIKFVRYVVDILGVWRDDRTEFNDKIRSMEDEEGIKLKLE